MLKNPTLEHQKVASDKKCTGSKIYWLKNILARKYSIENENGTKIWVQKYGYKTIQAGKCASSKIYLFEMYRLINVSPLQDHILMHQKVASDKKVTRTGSKIYRLKNMPARK